MLKSEKLYTQQCWYTSSSQRERIRVQDRETAVKTGRTTAQEHVVKKSPPHESRNESVGSNPVDQPGQLKAIPHKHSDKQWSREKNGTPVLHVQPGRVREKATLQHA